MFHSAEARTAEGININIKIRIRLGLIRLGVGMVWGCPIPLFPSLFTLLTPKLNFKLLICIFRRAEAEFIEPGNTWVVFIEP